MIRVSVIIPAYNAQAVIAQTLKALGAQHFLEPYEVIVVDDGSTDETSTIVQSFPAVRYVRQENAGPASARNHGAKLAQGEFLLFTDADCLPQENWIALIVLAFERTKAAAVCGSYGIANPQSALASGIHAEILFRHKHLMPDYPKSFGSYNVGIRKYIFEQLGGFNTTYRRASGEDNDLSYRLIKQGGVIYFERKALVNHYHTQALSRYLKEQFRHGMWRAQMYLDHPAMAQGDGYTFWKDILEMPWALVSCCAIILSAFGIIGFKQSLVYFLLPFFVFEILFGIKIIMQFFGGIYLGFAMWLRAFARLFGLSTGILSILIKIFRKKN